MKKFLLSGLFVAMLSLVYVPAQAHLFAVGLSDQITSQVDAGASTAGFGGSARDPRLIIASVVQIVLTLMGTIFMFLVLMSGYWLVISRGDDDKITKARKTILRATVGLLIVLMAYALTRYITTVITGAVLR